MNLRLLLSFLVLASLLACSSDDETPVCIDDIAAEFQSRACPNGGDLTIWTLRGEEVYCFNEGPCTADAEALIYSPDCQLICILGGDSGNDTCDGVSWSQNAELLETIYTF